MKTIRFPDFRFNYLDVLIILSICQKGGPCSVSDIRKMVDIAPNNLTRHLKDLEDVGILNIKDNGVGKPKVIVVNINDSRVFSFVNGLVDFYLAPPLSEAEQKRISKDREQFLALFNRENKK